MPCPALPLQLISLSHKKYDSERQRVVESHRKSQGMRDAMRLVPMAARTLPARPDETREPSLYYDPADETEAGRQARWAGEGWVGWARGGSGESSRHLTMRRLHSDASPSRPGLCWIADCCRYCCCCRECVAAPAGPVREHFPAANIGDQHYTLLK